MSPVELRQGWRWIWEQPRWWAAHRSDRFVVGAEQVDGWTEPTVCASRCEDDVRLVLHSDVQEGDQLVLSTSAPADVAIAVLRKAQEIGGAS